MAMYSSDRVFKRAPKKRTSQGDGLRKRGSFKKKGQKPYKGQGN